MKVLNGYQVNPNNMTGRYECLPLIENWCYVKGRYGLTLPYLYGASKHLGYNEDYPAYLNRIFKVKADLILTFCDSLDEYIIGFHKQEYPPINMLRRVNGISILEDGLEKMNDQEIISHLTKQYLDIVNQNYFSKDFYYNKWRAFTQSEIDKIESLSQCIT